MRFIHCKSCGCHTNALICPSCGARLRSRRLREGVRRGQARPQVRDDVEDDVREALYGWHSGCVELQSGEQDGEGEREQDGEGARERVDVVAEHA